MLLLINIFISVFQSKLKIKFETWRIFHNILGPSILTFAFIHSWFVGSDMQNNSLLQVVWIVLFLGTIFLFVFHRYLRPLLLRQHLYQVVEVLQESKNVWTITMSPPEQKKIFHYMPGQFHFITFHRDRDLPEEEHHWTISSSPTEEKYVSSTIKESGDFTATIGRTRPGDTATLHGAFGRFSYVLYPKEKNFVFIAGGIGITPFISMLRHMRDKHKTFPVLLLYANKEEGDILFRKELEEIRESEYPKLKIVHILSNPSVSWKGGTGHLDQEKIHALCSENIKEKSFYICGPQGLQESVIKNLHKLKVKSGKIHTEIFSFLD